MNIRAHRRINAPIGAVFDYVADTRNDGEWAPLVSDVEQIAGDGPAVGARYRFTQHAGKRSFPLEIEIVGFERPSRVVWAGQMRRRTYHATITFVERHGHTEVRQRNEVDYGVPIWVKPMVWLYAHRVLAKQLRAIAARLEARHQA